MQWLEEVSIPWTVALSGLEIAYPRPLFIGRQAILIREVGQTELVFGVLSGFISRSVRARLQVSVCNGYDLCHPDTQTHTETDKQIDRQTAFWPAYINSSAGWDKMIGAMSGYQAVLTATVVRDLWPSCCDWWPTRATHPIANVIVVCPPPPTTLRRYEFIVRAFDHPPAICLYHLLRTDPHDSPTWA